MTELLSQEQTQERSLPNGWTTASLQELSDINPRFGKDELSEDLEVTFLPMKCVEELSGKIDVSNSKQVSEVRKSYTPFQEEDVIFAKITPCMENGKMAVARSLKNGVGFGSSEFHVVRPHESVSRDFLFYFLVRSDFRKEAERNMTGSAGQRRVSTTYIKEAVLPLPPLNEQRRIVEKIEELFTKLDAGVRSLEQARAQLKSYRRSVLKAAVEGELSREWREDRRDELESASELLERILQERREKFAGKKYKEPASPDTSELPALPDGWEWASLEQLSWDSGYGTSTKCSYDFPGSPVLRIPNISRAKLRLEDIKFADPAAKLKHEEKLDPGDLLIIRTNGSRDLIGRAAVVKQGFERNHFFASYLIRYRLAGGDSLYRWIETIWHSHNIRSWMQETAATSAGQYNISVGALNRLTIPLPPEEEMNLISEEVERRLSVVDKLEATVEANLKQAGVLRQSILKQAFSGELVPQDPDDEPASALLELIRAERQATKQKTGKESARARRKVLTVDQTPKLFPEQGE